MSDIQPYIIVLRKLFHDDLWTSEKFTKGQAWVDLFFWAYHSDGNFKWDGRRYNLMRGQLCHTEEYLCNRWKWSRNKLRRTFKKWQEDGQLTIQRLEQRTAQQTAQPRNVITLCNYDKIQFTPKGNGTTNGTTVGTTVGQQTAQKRINNNNQYIRTNYKNARTKKDEARTKATYAHIARLTELYKQNETK